MNKLTPISDRLFTLAIYTATLIVAAGFIWVLTDVFIKGAGHLSLSFLLSEPSDAGRTGGIMPILLSTLWILAVALLAAVPLGLCVAIWLSEFTQTETWLAQQVRFALDVLAGVPSIVYGLFGNAFFSIYMGLGLSIISGGLTLACMILPIFIRTTERGLSSITDDWRKGAAALGMTRACSVWHIILPAASPAITTGLILGIGRATSETAALIFTSGYVDRVPESLFDSGRSLAVHIYDLSMNIPGGDPAAYGSALVLIILIITLNTLAQGLSDQWLERRMAHR